MKLFSAAILIAPLLTTAGMANENVRWVLPPAGPVSASDSEEAVPGRDLNVNPLEADTQWQEAYGSGNQPFTTAQVSVESGITPADSPPFNATGKLFMSFDGHNYVCTASVVGRSLLVTAAHCVHEFGKLDEGFVDSLRFEPARYKGTKPFGSWTATEVWIPKSYHDGTDKCLAEAPGVVCENDLALVVMAEQEGKAIGDVVARYALPDKDDFGYVDFASVPSAQITQLGYPSKDFDGLAMIRTDSLGIQQEPNNVVIGSNQTGGSSGGPWLQNFGTTTSHTGTPPTDSQPNTVTAVTSWGYTSDDVKIQGASRFSHNSVYTTKSNIQSLHDDVCAMHPDVC